MNNNCCRFNFWYTMMMMMMWILVCDKDAQIVVVQDDFKVIFVCCAAPALFYNLKNMQCLHAFKAHYVVTGHFLGAYINWELSNLMIDQYVEWYYVFPFVFFSLRFLFKEMKWTIQKSVYCKQRNKCNNVLIIYLIQK